MSRPGIDLAVVGVAPEPFAGRISVVAQTGSTNADLLDAAAAGAATGTVLVAEWQDAGRGRFDRSWLSPPRAGLTFSMLLRPVDVPPEHWGWLPLLTGLALRSAARSLLPAGAEVALKWPNDLLVGPSQGKAAGILIQAAGDAVVVGLGVNVSHTVDELPGPAATSLRLAYPDQPVERSELLAAVLTQFHRRYARWLAARGRLAGTGLDEEYLAACATLGLPVTVTRAEGSFAGRAVGVDQDGRLLVDDGGRRHEISAADIAHIATDPA